MPPAEMASYGLAACELKPLHPEKLRTCLARILTTVRTAEGATYVLAARSTAAATRPQEVSILVAEDNPVNQKVTMLMLRNLGYAAELATNGQEAIEALQRKPYTLILMDQQMPVMDGLEATRRIRAAQASGQTGFPPELRIVAMTANAMSGDRDACLAAGMDDYLAKPVRPEELRDVLAKYLRKENTGPGKMLQPALNLKVA
jgi:CheY-like chemotaxis protein